MNRSGVIGLVVAVGIGAATLPLSAEKAPAAPEARNAKMRGMRRHAIVWRVFSQLSESERKKMQELQRSNPEAFSAAMKKLADEYEKKERLRAHKLFSLIRKYRQSTDSEERARFKAEIVKMEKERFEERLQGLARTIAGTRRRLAFMEQELNKRKAKKEAIVEARTEALLSGEIPVNFSHSRRMGPPRPPRRAPVK